MVCHILISTAAKKKLEMYQSKVRTETYHVKICIFTVYSMQPCKFFILDEYAAVQVALFFFLRGSIVLLDNDPYGLR